jgi:hypothetical protein
MRGNAPRTEKIPTVYTERVEVKMKSTKVGYRLQFYCPINPMLISLD